MTTLIRIRISDATMMSLQLNLNVLARFADPKACEDIRFTVTQILRWSKPVLESAHLGKLHVLEEASK